jgi:hypothetical protein
MKGVLNFSTKEVSKVGLEELWLMNVFLLFSGQKLKYIVRRKTILKKVSTTLKVNFQ